MERSGWSHSPRRADEKADSGRTLSNCEESGRSWLGKKRTDFSPRKKAGGQRWLADWFPVIIAGTL